ncbi:hypothetical protein CR513_24819, partial [Mucuna pruriens]
MRRDETVMIVETISTNEDQKQAGAIFTIPSGYDFEATQEANADSNSTSAEPTKGSRPKQLKVEIMSAHLVPNPNQVGQTDPKSLIQNSSSPPPPMELKPLPNHLKYLYLDSEQQRPIIIANNLHQEQEDKLLEVLRQHKKAIGWKLSDLPGINPSICMHRILMEEEIKPIRQQQRRLNSTLLDVVKKEVTKLLAVGIIYPISDSQWVSPVQVVPKKSGMAVMKNQHDELVPKRIQNSWRVCIDYRRLNQATRKDHFPLPFIDQVLEKLSGKSHYCFLDGFSGYMQIHIAPEDQHKTTFTCPFGTFAYTRMPFGLCNEPSTFQRCMTSIFSDLLQECMEVFMDDFTVHADSFEACLENLSKVLKRCIDTNLVLNFEKCHLMVIEGIMLGHLVSNKGIEVDKSKIDIITSFPNPIFRYEKFAHSWDTQASTEDSSRTSANSSYHCPDYYKRMLISILTNPELKNRLTSAPILQAPNWDLPFELMCDASNSALGAVLGQRAGVGQLAHVIAYASRTMDLAQQNYMTTEKDLLAIVFALDKFRSYLLGSRIVVFSDHAALSCQAETDSGWMLLLQEFDIEIIDKKGAENSIADHLSRIEWEEDLMPIRDQFLDEQLLHIKTSTPWFADICNYVATSQFPPEASRLYKEKLQSDAKYYIWDDPYLWRLCSDKVIRRCIPETEINSVLQFYHSAPGGGHYGSTRTTRKVLDCGLYWPTIFRDAHQFVSTCDKCQKAGMAMNRRHEMPQQPILFCEVFDVWGIDFMGPFLLSNDYSYILLAVDYVSRWVEVIVTKTNDAKVVVDFLKSNIFYRFGVPKELISDQGSHFCNRAMASLLQKYGVTHRITTTYHPQTNGQAEVFNREIKKTLQKMTNPSRKD